MCFGFRNKSTDGSSGCLGDYPCDGLLAKNHGLNFVVNYPPAVNGSSVPAGQPCLPSSCSGPDAAACRDTRAATQRCFNCTGGWPTKKSGSVWAAEGAVKHP
jgi:hypothetical protein